MFWRVVLASASTNPSPSTLMVFRSAITFAWAGSTRSISRGRNDRSWMREPPGWSVKISELKNPARLSVIWLVAPRIGLAMWHSAQALPLKIGPSPAAVSLGPVNASTAVSKLHASSGIRGESSVSFASAAWFAQNSSANPLSSTRNPVRSFGGSALRLCCLVEPEHDQDRDGPHTRKSDDLDSSHLRLPEVRRVTNPRPAGAALRAASQPAEGRLNRRADQGLPRRP